jgi:hypothetical protein
MALIEIVHSTYAIAFYNPEKKSIEVTWHGHQTFEEYKSLFTTLLSFQRMSGFEVIGYVSDIRDQGVVSPNSRKCLSRLLYPKP